MKIPILIAAALIGLTVSPAIAGVTRFELTTRADVGSSGYEKIVGVAHFAIDPKSSVNRVIADIDRAVPNGAGLVEFDADLYILRPKDPARSNGVALFDILNRGVKLALQHFNAAPGRNDFSVDADFGNGFLMRQGYTIVWVGWQFDVFRGPGTMGISAPVAAGVAGVVRTDFTPNGSEDFLVSDLAGYTPVDPSAQDSTLTVRDGPFGSAEAIARNRWTVAANNMVTLAGGFQPGRTYELSYRAANPPIAGVGLAAVRDVASWLKHDSGAPAPARYAYATGASQSARFLRSFLYEGFNADEQGRIVFDGVQPFAAGASRLSINERWAVPNGNNFFRAATFPFADASTRDPASGRVEGLLDNDRARATQPKVLHLNTSSEYWGSGRSAALTHTAPGGASDLALPANTRIYLIAGSQHLGAQFPPRITTGQLPDNVNGLPIRKALLVALDRWVKDGVPPPPSRYPKFSELTLLPAGSAMFSNIPSISQPEGISAARDGDRVLPLLVPAVDADWNEMAGVRSPAVAVPLATYTGWNFRNPTIGAANELMPFLGGFVPFATTAAAREAKEDPRPSIAERYASKTVYQAAATKAAEQLVTEGFLLREDVASVLGRSDELWDLLTR